MTERCPHCGSRTGPTEAKRCQVCNSPGIEAEIRDRYACAVAAAMNYKGIVAWSEETMANMPTVNATVGKFLRDLSAQDVTTVR